MKNNKIDLSIVIGNYNNKKVLIECLSSLYPAIDNISYEIIVVDDASDDDSPNIIKKQFPKIRLIINETNLGYSKTYNKGTRLARGRYILHLNSDVVLEKKTKLNKLIAYLDVHRHIGILGCKIVRPDGSLDKPCKRSLPTLLNVFFQSTGLAFIFPKSRLFGSYYLTFLDENKIHEVGCLMGAFMLIRRRVIKQIGLLDDIFFIYGEDIDFCKRTIEAGWKIVYYPVSAVCHIHGATTGKSKFKYYLLFHQAMRLYYQKHYAGKNPLWINWVVNVSINLRLITTLLITLVKK